MHTSKGCIEEIYLDDRRAARLSCPAALVPAPGQYLMASSSSDTQAALSQPLFSAGTCPTGFFIAPPLPAHWLPGAELKLRGPLGHGFTLPGSARKVALIAWHLPGSRILALLEPALAQKASVVLLTDQHPANLPSVLEIQPLTALPEIIHWSDYLALETERSHLPALLPLLVPNLGSGYNLPARSGSAQILVDTPLPCAGMADCAICAVSLPPAKDYKLACKDGPVFTLY